MAASKCGSCGSSVAGWELKEVSVRGARYKMFFIQCASCGVPVAAAEYQNIGATLSTLGSEIGGALKKQDRALAGIVRSVDQLAQVVARALRR